MIDCDWSGSIAEILKNAYKIILGFAAGKKGRNFNRIQII